MIFFANRANLDKRTLLTRLHKRLDTRTGRADSPIEHVRYHTSAGTKRGVRAAVNPEAFLGSAHPADDVELQVSFDFPAERDQDCYRIQWVEADRDLMLGWHQDETHPDLGPCHFQIDHAGETVQRTEADLLDSHPLNVFDRRTDQLVTVLDALEWESGQPRVPVDVVR